ncbi:hypothetical protein ACLOJK_020887 [Asimina triloba]
MATSVRLESAFLSPLKLPSSLRKRNSTACLLSAVSSKNHLFSSSLIPRKTPLVIKASSSPSATVSGPGGIKVGSSSPILVFHLCFALYFDVEIGVKAIPTKPVEGQKTGTSGLRKKSMKCEALRLNEEALYWSLQALFNSLPPEDFKNGLLVLGGDGRYFNREAAQANGGFIMSASHNPGGPEYDWGVKFNYSSGQPAPETITDKIYGNTLSISEIKMADIPDVDLSCLGGTEYGNFKVEVIDPVSDYLELMESVFDFELIKSLISRSDFRFTFDAMHAVTGAYAKPIFVDRLRAAPGSIANGVPLEDFGHGHPDPNLTYAKDLVSLMFGKNGPDFGAASDGDGDRNMILGRGFFITPSDSVAMIAANAQAAIPYFKDGPKGLARSMPTSGALDRVAEKLNLPFFEVPTGWKFFGNLMDDGKLSICGEESFGTGSDHIREKDGIWAVLAWLSIIAHRNKGKKVGEKLVSVSDVAKEHWATYGRNFFSRYDYEECESGGANKMVEHLRALISKSKAGDKLGSYALQFADDFSYTDPVDGSVASKQGIRFVFTDGSRIIYRLSGTGSAGATIRVYIEQFEPDASKHDVDAQVALKPLIDLALSMSKLKEFTGREKPTRATGIAYIRISTNSHDRDCRVLSPSRSALIMSMGQVGLAIIMIMSRGQVGLVPIKISHDYINRPGTWDISINVQDNNSQQRGQRFCSPNMQKPVMSIETDISTTNCHMPVLLYNSSTQGWYPRDHNTNSTISSSHCSAPYIVLVAPFTIHNRVATSSFIVAPPL